MTDQHPLAARLRKFGLLEILAILVILFAGNVIGTALVLAWAAQSATPWRALGFVRPTSWTGTAAAGIVFGVTFKLLMKAIVMSLLGANPINPAYHFLAGNPAALPGMLLAVVFAAGFGEETIWRGFMFERLGKLWGTGVGPKTATVLVTAALFALYHYHDQGLAGAEQAMITGAVFGTIFAVTGRIWVVMFAHAAFDVAAVAVIYWNLESRVAHLFFK